MKFLLTSNGLSNQSIASALFELVGKTPDKTKIAFIPTAMNLTNGNKDWFINDLQNINNQKAEKIDIVDVSALPREVWLPRLEAADVIFFSGGNAFYLMKWIKETGLIEFLPKLLETRVWAGISAGSMVAGPSLVLSSKELRSYYEETYGEASDEALAFVDFYFRPHFNSPKKPERSEEYIREAAKNLERPVYALDDQSALKVTDGNVEIISEGKYLVLNKEQ